jgi:hypothetical protein
MPDGSLRDPDLDVEVGDAQLIANGYEPVAVEGKRALGTGWSTRPNTIEAVTADRAALPNATNTGLRTGRLVGLDIDIRDPAQAEAIQAIAFEVLGNGPMMRIGSKGAMLVYRNETSISKITITDHPPDGRKRRTLVEILGNGQQFVAYGIHPDTGKQYEWIDGIFNAPIHLPFDALSAVTPTRLREFAQRAAAQLAEWGYREVVVTDAGEPKRSAQRAPEQRWDRYPVPRDYLMEMLRYVNPGCDRQLWIGYLGGIQATNLLGVSERRWTRLCARSPSHGRAETIRTGKNRETTPVMRM